MRMYESGLERKRGGEIRLPLLLVQCLWFASTALGQEKAWVGAGALSQPLSGAYRIEVGDVLEISFFKTPQLNQTRIVAPDGDIHLALVGRVRAVGLSIDELAREVTEKYQRELIDPQVTVSVQNFSGMRVYVGGEVNQPSMLPYRGGLSLVQAIMNAGGFARTARRSSVVLIRKGQRGEARGALINVEEILDEGRLETDPALAPSDIVFVPRSRVADVNLFVEQYIQNNIPIPVVLGFNPFQR